jgi:O-Antigen ligase
MDSATRRLERPGDTVRAQPLHGESRLSALWRRVRPALPSTLLPFALVLYLALRDGGYDVVVRDEVGIALWLLLLVGSLAGVIPVVRTSRPALIALAALAGLTAWSALSMIWTESGEQTFEEIGRLLLFVGVFALTLALSDRWEPRRVLGAVAAALALVSALALLSRLHPAWFPADEVAAAEPEISGRLSYPIGAFSALGSLVAFAFPLVLVFAVRARALAAQAIAAAALPVLALTIYYTFSRVGLIAAVLGLAVYLGLERRRREALTVTAVGAVGSALAVLAAMQRDALDQGPGSALAHQQGDEMLAAILVASVGTALIRVAIELAVRHGLGPRPALPRLSPRAVLAGLAVVAIVAAVAAGVPSELSDRWEEFKQPATESTDASGRFNSASGNGRYQYWQASLDATASAPLTGIGAGAWELWWSREATIEGFSRFAHSLYFETAAELGVVGLALMAVLIVTVLVAGIRRTLHAEGEMRSLLAAAAAAVVVFAFAAGVDWTWQMTVIPVVFLIVSAVLIGPPVAEPSPPTRRTGRVGWAGRLPVAGIAVVAIGVLGVGLAGARLTSSAQDATEAGDPATGLDRARTAGSLQPFAATPLMEEAAAQMGNGDFEAAAALAREATEKEPTNWRPWYLLYQIEGELINVDLYAHRPPARHAYLQAQSLNPRSPLLATPVEQLTLLPRP